MKWSCVRAILAVWCWIACVPAVQAQAVWSALDRGAAGHFVATLQTDSAQPPALGSVWLDLDGKRIAPRSIVPLSNGASRNSIVLCLDRSGSMKGAGIAAVRAALNESLVPREGESRLSSVVAIIAFGSRVEMLADFTDDPSAIRTALERYAANRSGESRTRMHDALLQAVAMLRQGGGAARRIMVITDGKDEGSQVDDLNTVLHALSGERPPIPVDGIAFGELASQESGSIGTLAGRSGGRFAYARQQADLAAAIVKMVRSNVNARQFEVTLDYAAAADGSLARSAALVYQPAGSEPVTAPLPQMPALQSAPPPEPRLWWERLLDGVAKVHIGLKIVIGVVPVVMLGALGVYVQRRRKIVLLQRYHVEVRPAEATVPPPTVVRPTSSKADEKPALPPSGPARRSTVVGHQWPEPGNGKVVAVLWGVSGPGNGRRFALTRSSARVGASSDNDLVLDQDEFASARHAQMKAENFGLYVADLGSTNGTAVNGVAIRGDSRALVPGDKVRFGSSTFEVRTADEERNGRPPLESSTR